MSFWKKLFGFEESSKDGIVERGALQPSSTSSPQLPSNHSIPATSPQPKNPQALSVAVREKSTSFHVAVEGGDLDTAKTLLRENPDLVLSKNKEGRLPLHLAA